MSTEQILQIPRSDSVGDFVLINVARNGKSSLDLKLLGTEGESPYVTEIKQSRISKLRDKRSRLNDEQWESILLSSLLHRRVQIQKSETERLEITATIGGDVLTIHFRHNISGITQKLGEISLRQDESQELDITTWCGTAVQRSTKLEAEVQDLTSKYEEQSATMEKLNKQLEDFIEAKKTHEDALLGKFCELLNTKKLKIRDQQRLLASAKVDPKLAAKVEHAREISKPHVPATSRGGKRKAKGAATASESSDGESFEPKATTQKENSDASEPVDTPDASDQEVTEDESDDDLDSAPRKSTVPDRTNGSDNGDANKNMQLDTPPPTRILPFGDTDLDKGIEKLGEPAVVNRSTLNKEAGNEADETDDDDDDEL